MDCNLDIVVDLMWGSCGKGKFVSELAARHHYRGCMSSNMPNAGHTVVVGGERVVYKALCSASHLADVSYLSPASVFDASRLESEAKLARSVVIHENARCLLDGDKAAEATDAGLSALASTAQGSTMPMIRRVRRDPAGRAVGLPLPSNARVVGPTEWLSEMHGDILCEVSQGYGLSVDWGDFPYTTSRNCTPMDMLANIGVPHTSVRRVYGIIRPYPIRVGNASGYSGPMGEEITWDDVAAEAGAPHVAAMLKEAEMTTVTKRLRRVARVDWERLRTASDACGVDAVFINFGQYLDWGAAGCTDFDRLGGRVLDFVATVEGVTRRPVFGVGTGVSTTAWRM